MEMIEFPVERFFFAKKRKRMESVPMEAARERDVCCFPEYVWVL